MIDPLNEEAIFNVARKIDSAEGRLDYLKQVCGNDPATYGRVSMLLQLHDKERSFLESAPPGLAPTTTPPPLWQDPGAEIGPYKLREKIGEGGFGDVFVAEQETPIARKVALKIVKPGMATKDVIARFEAERQALALMDHPNVASVFDAGATADGQPYFVMELVHGLPIVEFCDAQKLSNQDRLRLFVDVCRAVQHAHHKGVIHRDLKPSNIMVTMHDDRPVPKVIDFGVAKALSQKLTENTVYTAYGHMVGTPLYMSPEQAQLSGLDVDTRSDVYSLGVLLYELLTGATPFDRETMKQAGLDEVRRIIIEDDPPIPSARVSTLHAETLSTVSDRRKIDQRKLSESLRGELDWIVMKALEKNRTRRYETVSKLAEDVENYLNDSPVEACPPSLAYRWTKFARRNRTALTTAMLVTLALVVGTCLSSWQAIRASAAQRDADEQRTAAIATAEQAQRNEEAARTQRDVAIAARDKLRRVLYASELNLVQAAWEAGSFRRAAQLLDDTRPGKEEEDLRGFEWHYWKRQLDLRESGKQPQARRDWSLALIDGVGEHWISPDEVDGGCLSSDGTQAAMLTDLRHFHEASVIRLWDVDNDRETCHYQEKRRNRGLASPMFAASGKRLVVVSHDARFTAAYKRKTHQGKQRESAELIVVDTMTGERLLTIAPENAMEIVGPMFDRQARWIAGMVVYGASVEKAKCRLVMWDAQSGTEVRSIAFEDEPAKLIGFPLPSGWSTPQFIGFTANGEQLLVASRIGGVASYESATGRRRIIVAADGTELSKFGAWSLSRDGKQLAVIGLKRFKMEAGAEIYDFDSGTMRLRLPLHTKYAPIAMAWNADGSRLLLLGSGGNGGARSQVALWDTVTGRLVLTLKHEGLQQNQLWREHIRFVDDDRRLVHVVGNTTGQKKAVHPVQAWDARPPTVDAKAKARND